MQKIIYTKSYKGKEKGDIGIVSNNVAHGLIELGVVELYSIYSARVVSEAKKTRAERKAEKRAKAMKSPVDKMMRAKKEDTDAKNKQKYEVKQAT